MKKGITQMREIILCLVTLACAAVHAKADDGKISGWETGTMLVKNSGLIITAFNGIDEVPAEFKDLDPAEMDLLMEPVLDLPVFKLSPDKEQIVGAIYDGVRQLLSSFRRVQNIMNPPRAEIVAEHVDYAADAADPGGPVPG